MRRILFLLFSGCMLVQLLSCGSSAIPSSSVGLSDIFIYHYISAQSDGPMYATSSFYSKTQLDNRMKRPYGTRVKLDGKASVTLNGIKMNEKKAFLDDIVYKSKTQWPSNFKWIFTDNKGRKHIHQTTMEPFTFKKKLYRVGRYYKITWQGAPLQRGEFMRVMVSYKGESYMAVTRAIGTRTIVIKSLPFGFMNMLYHIELTRFRRIRIKGKYFRSAKGDVQATGTLIELQYSVRK